MVPDHCLDLRPLCQQRCIELVGRRHIGRQLHHIVVLCERILQGQRRAVKKRYCLGHGEQIGDPVSVGRGRRQRLPAPNTNRSCAGLSQTISPFSSFFFLTPRGVRRRACIPRPKRGVVGWGTRDRDGTQRMTLSGSARSLLRLRRRKKKKKEANAGMT